MRLGGKWKERLEKLPGLLNGSQIVTIVLKDGSVVERVIVLNNEELYGSALWGFTEDDIADIVVPK